MTLSRFDHHTCPVSMNHQPVRETGRNSRKTDRRAIGRHRAPGTLSFEHKRVQYQGTQGKERQNKTIRPRNADRSNFSLADRTRTSHRSCVVVRECQSSPGDCIATSIRTSDGPSRHQVSGTILQPLSDRDRRACPELQDFVLQHVRDRDVDNQGMSRGSSAASLSRSFPCSPPQGDPRDGPPPFCSRA